MTRNFHANITVWKTFPRVQSINKKSILNFSLTWRQRALMNSYHRRSSLKKFSLVTGLVKKFLFSSLTDLCPMFLLLSFYDYYSLFCLLLAPFLPSSFSILLLTSKFVFFFTVTGSFLLQMKTKFKYLMRCWKGNGRKGVDFKFLLQHALCLCDWQSVTNFCSPFKCRSIFFSLLVTKIHRRKGLKGRCESRRKKSHFSLGSFTYYVTQNGNLLDPLPSSFQILNEEIFSLVKPATKSQNTPPSPLKSERPLCH